MAHLCNTVLKNGETFGNITLPVAVQNITVIKFRLPTVYDVTSAVVCKQITNDVIYNQASSRFAMVTNSLKM
jgi:hypothetical protein